MADGGLSALLSLHPRFAEALLIGDKCVELRRRRPHLPVGTKLWFYSKIPVASIVGVGTVRDVLTGTLNEVWNRFSRCSGVSRADFDAYLSGSMSCSVIMFSEVAAAEIPLSLLELRRSEPTFNPPQFFRWLSGGNLQDAFARIPLREPVQSCDH